MRKIVLLFILIIFANAKDYEEIYLKNGAKAVINAIEKNILSKDYWVNKLKDTDVKYGYYDNEILLTIVDKTAKNLKVISYKNGVLNKIFASNVIVGKSGDKLAEGDLKTPIGVYELTRRFTPSDRYLGPLAFSLSYPNLLDKLAHRNGGGIWIHGYPLDGSRTDELKTKGCVAMENDILMQYDKLIDYKKSLALIYEKTLPITDSNEIATIISGLFKWKKSWTDSNIDEYLKFYDKDFARYDGMSLANFKAMKKMIFSRNESKEIRFSNFIITPYPNSKNDKLFRVSFYEDYTSSTHKFQGQKTLYIKLYGDEMKIFIEE
ncbi:L,D-transpeptidase family protein [Campylobacter sp. faydin G-24]|uniref:L,D-transpeptidase family protein n=1 Tax=Campylobacter anatolicus TaxID=2829105 RepID=A0ABS5HK03_9BACT|nr:L,D-transpeptidase family protein [Campylobacter anatolicus]MBR8462605.1 L,D-transpeptidase family protein [Campylobacter anatolicus]MBR8464595.1 L,D-transpeptidase family protein [Campylobacter anatolicus]MBR8465717.1 L,D-transpeptidase family protein [Campylobacter anatolicus]